MRASVALAFDEFVLATITWSNSSRSIVAVLSDRIQHVSVVSQNLGDLGLHIRWWYRGFGTNSAVTSRPSSGSKVSGLPQERMLSGGMKDGNLKRCLTLCTGDWNSS